MWLAAVGRVRLTLTFLFRFDRWVKCVGNFRTENEYQTRVVGLTFPVQAVNAFLVLWWITFTAPTINFLAVQVCWLLPFRLCLRACEEAVRRCTGD